MNTTPTLSATAQTVLDKVRALRDYTEATGFHTTRSQNELIQGLKDVNDFATVLLVLKQGK